MAWVKINVNNLGDIKVHFTPLENFESIKANGILLPNKAREVVNHISPYDYWDTTKLHPKSGEKDKYTYFGVVGTKTFKDWTADKSFSDRNIGFILKSENHFVELYDIFGLKRYRVDHDISFEDVKCTIQFVSKIPDKNSWFDYLVVYEDDSYKVYEWKR